MMLCIWFSVYVTALMRVLWGETQEEKEEEEKEEEVGGHEGAFTEITNFFFDLANKIQLRQVYLHGLCISSASYTASGQGTGRKVQAKRCTKLGYIGNCPDSFSFGANRQ